MNETTGWEDEFEMIKISKNLEIFVFNSTKDIIQKYTFDGKLEKDYDTIEEADLIEIAETGKILVNDVKNF